MHFTEKEILEQLDLAFNGIPSSFYPPGSKNDIKYNFFLDLEHGFFKTAGSKIHLYADSMNWAVVFEKSGYQIQSSSAEIELNYIGNCIIYPVEKYPERNYISNASNIILITPEEYEKIRNKEGSNMENFELINPNSKEVNIHNNKILIEHDLKKYENLGIKIRDYDNSKNLVSYVDLIRYLNETNPGVVSATEEEIKMHIPKDLPKIISIEKFHFSSIYNKQNLPSKQETFKLIAKILVNRNSKFWMPKLKENNHWSNWKSGNL